MQTLINDVARKKKPKRCFIHLLRCKRGKTIIWKCHNEILFSKVKKQSLKKNVYIKKHWKNHSKGLTKKTKKAITK